MFLSAILNPYLKRATYNPNAPLATPEDILYQMKVGGVVGGLVGGAANVSGVGVNSNVQTNAGNVNSTNIAVTNDVNLSAEQLNVMQEMAKLKASEQSGTLSEDPNIAGMQLWLEVFRQEGIEVPEIALTMENSSGIVSESDKVSEFSSNESASEVADIPKRPTWKQSELDAGDLYPGYDTQKSFLNGDVVPHGTEGSSRPEYYLDGHSVEVKNYKIDTNRGINNLANNVSKQVNKRINNLPPFTEQTIVIDVRGQNYTNEILRKIIAQITARCKIKVKIIFLK